MHFKVFDDIDSPHASSVEYYMIDFDPMFDHSNNVNSFMFFDNEMQSSTIRCPDVDGDLFDVVDEHNVSFIDKSSGVTLCSSSNRRVKRVFCQPTSSSFDLFLQAPKLLKQ